MNFTDYMTPSFKEFSNTNNHIFINQYKYDYMGSINESSIEICNPFKKIYLDINQLFTETPTNSGFIHLIHLHFIITSFMVISSIYDNIKQRRNRNRVNTIMNFLNYHGLLNTRWELNIFNIIAYCINHDDNSLSNDEFNEIIDNIDETDNTDSNTDSIEDTYISSDTDYEYNIDNEFNDDEIVIEDEIEEVIEDNDNTKITFKKLEEFILFTELNEDKVLTDISTILHDKNIISIIRIFLDNMTLKQLKSISRRTDKQFIYKLINKNDEFKFNEKEIYAYATLITIYRRYLGLSTNTNNQTNNYENTQSICFNNKFNNPLEVLVINNKFNVNTLSSLNEFILNTNNSNLLLSIYKIHELIISNIKYF